MNAVSDAPGPLDWAASLVALPVALTTGAVMALDFSWSLYWAIVLVGPVALMALLCRWRRIGPPWNVVLVALCLAATIAIQVAGWSGVD